MTSTPALTETVPLLLTTRTAYPLPLSRILIPSSFTRYHLSQLINTSLSLNPPVPFDFLIRSHLLRGSIGGWMRANGVSAEELLEVEYIRSVLPPKVVGKIEQDDWVSALSLSLPHAIITGAYDHTLRIYTLAQEERHILHTHTAPITSVLTFPSPNSSGHVLASSSQDRTVHLQLLPPHPLDPASAPKWVTTLHTSQAQVSSVSVSPDRARLATATWDGVVGVFSSTIPTSHELAEPEDVELQALGPKSKKRKLRSTGEGTGTADEVFRKAPQLLLRGHEGKVSRAVFTPDALASAGWDGSVRVWDLESGVARVVKTTPDRVHLTLASTGPHLLTGTSDRFLTLTDPRSSALTSLTLAHSSPVNNVIPHPEPGMEHLVSSGTLAGVVRVWDLRAGREVVRVDRGGGGGKMLALDWRPAAMREEGAGAGEGEGGGVWAAGGEDKKVWVFTEGN
ncbi:ribosome biogenesis protein YTM1 [Dacryopinax primogenitus]|uniref:Ribosome biogenesis protein YTM1 n=1 Tax=Dacryopinax primogenitus (strain DJM 731) TaxID=1858805 RepID=M5FUV5_DACPD|nr:ribosome biogenesis protein YTM1 [Dacryopinax primogenitus]EJU01551.1 ribosome biogenesis protein YTM1 [Dacryopinax primogenitus]